MTKQLLGSEAGLKKTGDLSMEPSGKTGNMTVQEVGTTASIAQTPTPTEINGAIKEGTRQLLGSEAPLNFTPSRGWQSHPAPMSQRSKKQGE